MKKCYDHPVFDTGIRTHDLSEHESPPITLDQGSHPLIALLRNIFITQKIFFV